MSEPPPSSSFEADLAELEERAARFSEAAEQLTRKTSRKESKRPVPVSAKPEASEDDSHAFFPAMPAAVADEGPSGLRPAVDPAAATGALTARHRAGEQRPSFTSAIGRPQLPAPSAIRPAVPPTVVTRREQRSWRPPRWLLWTALAASPLVLVAALIVSVRFPVLRGSMVVARTVPITAPADGSISAFLALVGSPVRAGEAVVRITTAANTLNPERSTTGASPADGVLTTQRMQIGRRVNQGEVVADVALPATLCVVASIPESLEDAVRTGSRAEIQLIADRRTIDGTVTRIIGPGEDPGPDLPIGVAVRTSAVIVPDPGPRQPTLGQGATVTIIGERPGALRLFLLRLRQSLSW